MHLNWRPVTHTEWLRALGIKTCVGCASLIHEDNEGILYRGKRWCDSCFLKGDDRSKDEPDEQSGMMKLFEG
jgi:hypothetical protein